jgi:hypothetical protein
MSEAAERERTTDRSLGIRGMANVAERAQRASGSVFGVTS